MPTMSSSETRSAALPPPPDCATRERVRTINEPPLRGAYRLVSAWERRLLPLPQGQRPFLLETEVSDGTLGGHPTPRGPLQEAELEEIGLVHVLDGFGLLPHRGGQSREPDGTSGEL